MPADPLRERLKALVEVWRSVADEWRRAADTCERGSITDVLLRRDICVTKDHADKLEALLAESEPEPCARCGRTDCDGGCRARAPFVRISRDDVARVFGHRCDSPTCPACKSQPEPATLKLGHAYCGPEDGSDCKITMDYSPEGKCWLRCGQPREAHER